MASWWSLTLLRRLIVLINLLLQNDLAIRSQRVCHPLQHYSVSQRQTFVSAIQYQYHVYSNARI